MTTATARRTKRPSLTREAVITAAMDLADREGLDALTIRRLATETGVTPMALYWHVKDKDELLSGLGERLFAEIELPPLSRKAWHVQLRAVLVELLVSLRRHPAAAALALQTVLDSDAGLVLAERVLGLLREGGLAPRAAAETGTFLLTSIMAMVTEDAAMRAADERSDHDEEAKRAALAALPRSQFPNVAALAGHLMDCGSDDAFFNHNLDLLLRGIRAATG